MSSFDTLLTEQARMNWYQNLSIKNKLWLLTGSFFASLVLVIAVAFWSQQKLASDLDEIANRYFVASQLLLEADANLYRAVQAERSILVISPNAPNYQGMINFHKQNIEEAEAKLRRFKSILNDGTINSLLSKYQELNSEWQTLSFQVIELRNQNTRESRRDARNLTLRDANIKFSEMHDVVDKITDYVNQESKRTVETAEQNKIVSASAISTVAIIVFVTGTIFTLMAIGLIASPLKELTGRLKQISSGDGDLTQRLDESRKDEIGETAAAFNKFTQNQADIIQQVKQSMDSFMSSMDFVSQHMNELRDATSEQQSESDRVSDSMNQMSGAVNDIAANAAQAAEATQEANNLSIKGSEVVNESVSTINEITSNIAATSEVVQKLDSRTQSISSVTNNISEIADQTNLLALNAAIEAARAGEQGRGFAVVAEEVRNLAKKTQELTEEIYENIESLSEESTAAVKVMEESLANSKVLDEKAEQSGNALKDINDSVDSIAGMNLTVASAVEEQSVTAVEINRSVDSLKVMAIESDEHAQETQNKVKSLVKLASDIQGLLNRFKTE